MKKRFTEEQIVKILEECRYGIPTDNRHIESFNGTFRYDCLNANHFSSIKNAKNIIDDWWLEYNTERSQKRLKGDDSKRI